MWLSDVCHHLDCKGEVGQDLAGLTRASTWTALSGTSLKASAIFAIRSGIRAGVKNSDGVGSAAAKSWVSRSWRRDRGARRDAKYRTFRYNELWEGLWAWRAVTRGRICGCLSSVTDAGLQCDLQVPAGAASLLCGLADWWLM